jgi:hypothetical protein
MKVKENIPMARDALHLEPLVLLPLVGVDGSCGDGSCGDGSCGDDVPSEKVTAGCDVTY